MIKYFQKGELFHFKNYINKRLSLIFLGDIALVCFNILIVKILTNKLSIAQYGIYALIISLSTFPQIVIFAPIASSIFPFINNKKQTDSYKDFQKDIFSILLFIFILFLVIATIIYLINYFVTILPYYLIKIGIVAFLFSTSLSWLSTLDTFSLANLKIKEYTFFPIINLLIRLVILLILFNLKVTPISLIGFFSAAQFLWCFIEYKYLLKKGILTYTLMPSLNSIFQFYSQNKIEIYKYSQNFTLWGIFTWGQTFFDKWFLNHYVGSSIVAIYAIYYQYGFFPFSLFSGVIGKYLTPIYFVKASDPNKSLIFIKRLLKTSLIFLIISLIVLTEFAIHIGPYFINLFTNSSYLLYINMYSIVVVAGIFFCFGQILTVPLLNSKNVKKIRFPKICTAIIAIFLFALLTPKYGFKGIIFSLFLSNCLYFIFLLFINFNELKIMSLKNNI